MDQCKAGEGEAGREAPEALKGHIRDQRGCMSPPSKQLLTTKSASFSAPPASALVSSGGTIVTTETEGFPSASEDTTTGSDCVICFNQYSLSRLPKLLACRHVLCAVCLKLLLRNDRSAWRIVCPICREPTPVFGGLVCSLDTEESVFLGPLASRGFNSEGPFGLDARSSKRPLQGISWMDQGDGRDCVQSPPGNRVAVKRLLFLLLTLMLLGLFLLPFVSRGLLQWALGVALSCGSVLTGVLCWNPEWRCCCSFPSLRTRDLQDPPVP